MLVFFNFQVVRRHEQNVAQTAVQNHSCVCCTSCVNSRLCTKVYNTHYIGSTVSRYNKETSMDETSLSDSSARYQLYPPGRIIHMVTKPEQDIDSTSDSITTDECISIYETPRCMYGKVWLSQNMIHDHYMPTYIKTMEQLINRSQKKVDVVSADMLV